MAYSKLKRSWQFDKIYKEGNKYSDDLFVIYVLANNTREVGIGLTVTKKVGTSVQRNRIKRIVREVLRLQKGIIPGNDLVVIARKSAVDLEYSQARDSLGCLLQRAKILKN